MGELSYTTGGDSNLVSFKSSARVPITSIKAHFLPKQDLHGYSKPWPGGSGKNLFNVNTPIEYGAYHSSTGEFSNAQNRIITDYIPINYNITYTMKINSNSDNLAFINYNLFDENKIWLCSRTGNNDESFSGNTEHSFTININDAKYIRIVFRDYNDSTVVIDDRTLQNSQLQLEIGTSATSYEPYENVCPIVGWNECEIYKIGYNIFDEEYEDGGLNDSTGNNQPDSSFIRSKNYIPCRPNTSYCFSYTHAEPYSANLHVYYYDINKQHIRNTWITPKQVVTSHSRAYYMRFYMDSAYKKDGLRDVSINYPSTDTQYHAYCGECIPITFPITGKNLFDPNCSMWNHGVYVKNEDEITQTGSDGRGWTDSNFLSMPLPAGTYTITCSDGNVLTVATSIDNYETLIRLANGGGTFTLSEDCKVKIKHSASNYPTSFTVQLEYGNTVTAYEPYNSNNTIYGGYVDITAGEIVATHQKLIADGSITWTFGAYPSNQNNRVLKGVTALGGRAPDTTKMQKCPFNYIKSDANVTGVWQGYIATTGNVVLRIPEEIASAQDWSDYLAEHPLEFVYELQTPIHYPLSKIELKTLLGQNNFQSNTNSTTEVSYAIHDTALIRAARHRIAAAEPHIVKPAAAPLQNFVTDMAAPLKECKVYFNPVQEGSGDPSPDNIRPITGWTSLTAYHSSENLYIPNENNKGYIKSDGTVVVDNHSTYTNLIPVVVGDIYSFKCTTVSINGSTNRRIHGYDSSSDWVSQLKVVTTAENTVENVNIMVTIPSGISYIRVSFRLGDINPRVAKENVYKADWTDEAGTIYGGYVNLVTGEVWETHKKKQIVQNENDTSWNSWGAKLMYNTGILGTNNEKRKAGTIVLSDTLIPIGGTVNPQQVTSLDEIRYYGVDVRYPQYFFMANPNELSYTEWRNWLYNTYQNAHVCYELETPVLLATLTPTQLKTLRGTNNIWSNANGNIELSYWKH